MAREGRGDKIAQGLAGRHVSTRVVCHNPTANSVLWGSPITTSKRKKNGDQPRVAQIRISSVRVVNTPCYIVPSSCAAGVSGIENVQICDTRSASPYWLQCFCAQKIEQRLTTEIWQFYSQSFAEVEEA